MGNAVATLVGQNLGAGHPDRAEKTVWIATLYNTIIVTSVIVLFYIFRFQVLGVFNQGEGGAAVIAAGAWILTFTSIAAILMPAGFVPLRGLNGAGDTITAMLISSGILWVIQIPMCALLGGMMGQNGVWLGVDIGAALTAVLAMLIFRAGKWKRVRV